MRTTSLSLIPSVFIDESGSDETDGGTDESRHLVADLKRQSAHLRSDDAREREHRLPDAHHFASFARRHGLDAEMRRYGAQRRRGERERHESDVDEGEARRERDGELGDDRH